MVNKVLLSHRSGDNGDYFSFELVEPTFPTKIPLKWKGQLIFYTKSYICTLNGISYIATVVVVLVQQNYVSELEILLLIAYVLESQRDTSNNVKNVYIKFLPPC